MTIRAYAVDHGIQGSDLRLFHTFISMLDVEWLKHVDERMKQERGTKDGSR